MANEKSSGMPSSPSKHSKLIDECIKRCDDASMMISRTIMHCLKMGGEHADPDHIRLMWDTMKLAEVNRSLMLRESPYHMDICELLSRVARECAQSCLSFGNDKIMKACAEACNRCADSCEKMAGM